MHTYINTDFKLKFKFSFKIMLSILMFKFFSPCISSKIMLISHGSPPQQIWLYHFKLSWHHHTGLYIVHPSIVSKTIAHLKLVPNVYNSLRCRRLNAFNIPSRRCLLGGHSITIVCRCVYCVLMSISANGKF